MAAADATIRIQALMDDSDLQSRLAALPGIAGKIGGAIGVIGPAFSAAAGAAMNFVRSSVDVGAQFDSAMSQVAATMGKTTDEISELRDFAREMGASTAFSATEAAEALNFMALAGYDAEKSMEMLPNVLNLAAAGGMALQSASDMVTDAQSALGLSMEETTALVDKMAKTSSKSNTSVAQLGEAILGVGGTAKMLAGGTTELNTALGLLADNGIKGSEGGTALRNILLDLTGKTKPAREALEALGISAYDADGNMRPLNETFRDFQLALDGVSDKDRTKYLNDIFGAVDLKAVNALIDTSAERWTELAASIDGAWYSVQSLDTALKEHGSSYETLQKNLEQVGITQEQFNDALDRSQGGYEAFLENLGELTDGSHEWSEVLDAMGISVEDLAAAFEETAGAAQQMADTQLENLKGDITKLKSAISEAKITIADQLTPSLREFAKFGTDAVNRVTNAFKEGGVSGAMDEFASVITDGLDLLINTIVDHLPDLAEAGAQIIAGLVVGIVKNLPKLGLEVIPAIAEGLIKGFCSALGIHSPSTVFEGFGENIMQGLINGLGNLISDLGAKVVEIGGALVNGIVEGVKGIPQAVADIGGGIVDFVKGIFKKPMEDAGEEAGTGMAQGVQTGIEANTAGAGKSAEELKDAVLSSLDGMPEGVAETSDKMIADMVAEIDSGAKNAAAAMENLKSDTVGAFEPAPGELEKLGADMMDQLDGSITQGGKDVTNSAEKLSDDIVSSFDDTPGELKDVGSDMMVEMLDGVDRNSGDIVDAMETLSDDSVSAFDETPGELKKVGTDMMNQMEAGIDAEKGDITGSNGVVPNIEKDIRGTFDKTPGELNKTGVDMIDKLGKGAESMRAPTKSVMESLGDMVKGAFTSVADKMFSIGGNIVSGLKRGISEGWSSFTSWLGGKVNGMVAGVKSKLKINSPSKVFAEIGEYTAKGMQVGFDAEFQKVNRNVINSVSKLADAAQKAAGSVKKSLKTAASADYDPNVDYSALMKQAKTFAEFNELAAKRTAKAAGEGIDITARGFKSNAEILEEWKNAYDAAVDYSVLMEAAESLEEFQILAAKRTAKAIGEGIDITKSGFQSNEEILEQWKQKFIEKTDTAGKSFSDFTVEVAEEADGMADQMQECANQMMESLSNGMLSAAPMVYDAAKEIAAKTSTILKSALVMDDTVEYDPNVDYSALMEQAKSLEEFNELAAKRAAKAAGEGIDLIANGYRESAEILEQWKNTYDSAVDYSVLMEAATSLEEFEAMAAKRTAKIYGEHIDVVEQGFRSNEEILEQWTRKFAQTVDDAGDTFTVFTDDVQQQAKELSAKAPELATSMIDDLVKGMLQEAPLAYKAMQEIAENMSAAFSSSLNLDTGIANAVMKLQGLPATTVSPIAYRLTSVTNSSDSASSGINARQEMRDVLSSFRNEMISDIKNAFAGMGVYMDTQKVGQMVERYKSNTDRAYAR